MTVFCFERGRELPEEVKRVVRDEIAAAIAGLTRHPVSKRDEAIHEARKSVKKIRGVLRLVQSELGSLYSLENALFRDIGRQLSQFRDASATIETFDVLRKKYGSRLDARALGSIRRGLVARKGATEVQGGIEEILSAMATALNRAEARVNGWPLRERGFAAIAPGLQATLRRGHKAMSRARKHRRPDDFHDWRKRVKEHWYQVRLLESVWDDDLRAYERKLKSLEESLGEDHNLVVLRERLKAVPALYKTKSHAQLLEEVIAAFHQELSEKAVALGKEIYREKPGHFTRKIARLWEPRPAKKNGRPKAAVSAPA